jgi:hypothetical protein
MHGQSVLKKSNHFFLKKKQKQKKIQELIDSATSAKYNKSVVYSITYIKIY